MQARAEASGSVRPMSFLSKKGAEVGRILVSVCVAYSPFWLVACGALPALTQEILLAVAGEAGQARCHCSLYQKSDHFTVGALRGSLSDSSADWPVNWESVLWLIPRISHNVSLVVLRGTACLYGVLTQTYAIRPGPCAWYSYS